MQIRGSPPELTIVESQIDVSSGFMQDNTDEDYNSRLAAADGLSWS